MTDRLLQTDVNLITEAFHQAGFIVHYTPRPPSFLFSKNHKLVGMLKWVVYQGWTPWFCGPEVVMTNDLSRVIQELQEIVPLMQDAHDAMAGLSKSGSAKREAAYKGILCAYYHRQSAQPPVPPDSVEELKALALEAANLLWNCRTYKPKPSDAVLLESNQKIHALLGKIGYPTKKGKP